MIEQFPEINIDIDEEVSDSLVSSRQELEEEFKEEHLV